MTLAFASLTLLASLPLAAAGASPAGGVALTRATGALVDVTRGERTVSHEKAIAPAVASAVFDGLEGPCKGSNSLLRVPGRAERFLVSGPGCGAKSSEDDFGLRLTLVEKTKGGLKVVAQGHGVGDSYSLRPVVYAGGGRTIVLAEMATEYSWGLSVYEITGDALVALGSIDAGVVGEEGEEDPTPFARVRVEGAKLTVTFDSDLVIGTGNEDSKVALKPVVFRQAAKGFELVRPRYRGGK